MVHKSGVADWLRKKNCKLASEKDKCQCQKKEIQNYLEP